MSDTIRNPELYNVRSGDTTQEVDIDLAKARVGGRGSDHFLAGRYLFEVVKAEWRAKAQDKPGRNCVVQVKSVGPEGCSENGKMLTRYIPAPAGASEQAETGEQMLADMLVAILSWEGKLEVALASGQHARFKPAGIVGRRFAAEVADDQPYQSKSGNMIQRSQITRYLLKLEYDARPGPDLSATPAATTTATKATGAAVGGADLMAAAGAAEAKGGNAATPPGATAAVDALIF